MALFVMSAKDDDFWNSGAQNSFNFDEEEVKYNFQHYFYKRHCLMV